jgi:hypothetical protein
MKVYAAPALLLLLLAPAITAQSPLQTAPPAGVKDGPPPASAGIFPLKDVHRGLRGTAWTVFEGTAPEPMGVEVLGTLRNAAGPGEDIILVRLSGAKAEYTGVVAGMSGSPVYFDGKLAGALAFRIGQFSKEPIAGVTPIERMLEVRDLAPGAAELVPVSTSSGSASNEQMRPIETPLVFSGFTPEALKLWRDHAPSLALEPVAGLGGASAADAAPSTTPLVPGSAVSALLVRGDLEIAATCTVTYVDAKHLLACGHPITQFGPVSMPMTRADVVATLPSPLNAFKIVNTTETIGSFTEDRQSAISGVLGLSARMIPMTIRIADPSASTRTLHLEIVNQPQLTPSAVLVSVFQSLTETNRAETESSYRVGGTIRIAGQPDVAIDSIVSASDQEPASLAAALTAGEPFSRLYDSPARRTPITSVDLALKRLPGRHIVQITDAHLEQATVRAGQPVTVDVTLEPYRAEPLHRQVTFTLPATLEPGTVRLLVSDAGTLDRLTQPARGASPDLGATIAQINSTHANDRLYVTLLTNNLEATLDGRVLGTLPASAANILEPERAAQKLTLNGESLLPIASLAASPRPDAMVAGQQVLLLRVE